jgi:hypothetical protein
MKSFHISWVEILIGATGNKNHYHKKFDMTILICRKNVWSLSNFEH